MPQFAAMDRKEGDVSKRRFAAMVERMVVGHMRARASRPQNAAVEICDEQEASKPQNATMDRDEREASMPQHAAMVCRIRARRERARASMLQTAATYRAMANGGTAYARRNGRYAGGGADGTDGTDGVDGADGAVGVVVEDGSMSCIAVPSQAFGAGARCGWAAVQGMYPVYVAPRARARGQMLTNVDRSGKWDVDVRGASGADGRVRWARALGAGAGRMIRPVVSDLRGG
jgi:hypothetical protein